MPRNYVETITITALSPDSEQLVGTVTFRDGTTQALAGEYEAIPVGENGEDPWGTWDEDGNPTFYTRPGSFWAIDVCLYDLPNITVHELRSCNDQALTLWLAQQQQG